MTDALHDPVNAPYWRAAQEGRLTVQACSACGHRQLYGRPFCLSCESDAVRWETASGRGKIYSVTTVHLPVSAELTPPYQVAIVALDEGPRLLAGIEGAHVAIDDLVEVGWRTRPDGSLLPIFRLALLD